MLLKYSKEYKKTDNLSFVLLAYQMMMATTIATMKFQINHLKKIVIVRSDFDDKSVSDFTALINPQIIKFEGEITKDFEGCLSVPDVYGMVPRYSKIRVKAKDINGNDVRFKADGFLARIIQHEVDHVNGIVFIDHIRDDKDAFFKLDKDGELQPLDYERYVKKNNILWD